MNRLAATALAIAAVALLAAAPASAGLPKPRGTDVVKVPRSIAGVRLGMKIKSADKAWGKRGRCGRKGIRSCTYRGRNRRAGSASIGAARHGRVSSVGIYAGLDRHDRYVFRSRLAKFETRRGIGLGDNGAKVARAYPKAIKAANRLGYIVPGRGRSYMMFQTLDRKHITAITAVDGVHQGRSAAAPAAGPAHSPSRPR